MCEFYILVIDYNYIKREKLGNSFFFGIVLIISLFFLIFLNLNNILEFVIIYKFMLW